MFTQAEKDFIAIHNWNINYFDKKLREVENLDFLQLELAKTTTPYRKNLSQDEKDNYNIFKKAHNEWFDLMVELNKEIEQWNEKLKVIIDKYNFIKLKDFLYSENYTTFYSVTLASKILNLSNIEKIPKLYQINSHLKYGKCVRINLYPYDWLMDKREIIQLYNSEI